MKNIEMILNGEDPRPSFCALIVSIECIFILTSLKICFIRIMCDGKEELR